MKEIRGPSRKGCQENSCQTTHFIQKIHSYYIHSLYGIVSGGAQVYQPPYSCSVPFALNDYEQIRYI